MRYLTPSLLAAQKDASAVPYVSVQIRERIANVARLRWERLYSGSEADHHHAAAMPGDGSLLRARVDPSTGALYRQRVANPGPGSDFATWTFQVTVSVSAGICMAARGAEVLLFYVDTDDRTIRCVASADYGASFGEPIGVVTAAGAVGWMASALKGDGTALLVYSVGATVYAVKRSSGAWGSPAAWSNSVASVAGLACCYSVDFDVAVAGADASGTARLWTTIYGDGFNQPVGTWSALKELARADSGSSVQFGAPSLDRADCYRLFFVERYGGSQAYSRPLWSNLPPLGDFTTHTWREPVPFDFSTEYGLAVAHSGDHAWLSAPSGVWRASLLTPSLDVSEDVLELHMACEPFDGRLRLVLRNDEGRYSDLSSTSIKRGSQVEVSPGLVTGSGPEVSPALCFWVEGWEHGGGGGATLTLLARDGWSLIEGWRARREYAWAAGESSVFQILSFVFSRAGLQYACRSSSATLGTLRPTFAIHPGENGRTAVQRLLAMVPDVVFMSGSDVVGVNPVANEEAVYAYGDGHVILSGRYAVRTAPYNRVQVFGRGLMLDCADWPGVAEVYDRLSQVHDVNLTTADMLQARAAAAIREAEMASLAGEIVVPVNCGQELYDVVTIDDAAAGLVAARRRVVGVSLRYSRHKTPHYVMRIALAAA